jgi:hypothetical protein
MKKARKKRWIQRALHKHKKGALHRQLGIPEGETIPISLLRDAAHETGLLGQRARFALNVRKIRRKNNGKTRKEKGSR